MKKIALSVICVLTLTACNFGGLFPRSSTSNNYSYSNVAPSSSIITSSSSETPSSSSLISSSSSSIKSSTSDTPSSSSVITSSSSSSSSSSFLPDEDPYNGYYTSLTSWTNGEDLKSQLHAIMRDGYQPLSYAGNTTNWESNIKADHTKYNFEYLDAVYDDADIRASETNKGWQREHAFCASLMTGSLTGAAVKFKGRATDFHNLFAAQSSANGSRGNKNYGIANTSAVDYTNRTKNSGEDGYSYDGINFEPGDKDKGRLARALLYMATMYKDDEFDPENNITMKGLRIVEEPVTFISGNSGHFAIGNLSTLLDWNNNIPVDYLEMQHNVSVYQDVISIDGFAQGNRNPYIDFPQLADYVYGDKKNTPGTLTSLTSSEQLLNSDEHVFSHYALKSVTREHQIGEILSTSDYEVVKVYKDYSYESVTTGVTHSLEGHIFSAEDGHSIDATISIEDQTFNYTIILNPMAATASGAIFLSYKTGDFNIITPGVDQNVTYGGIDFKLNFTTSGDGLTQGLNVSNINTNGPGITFGSGPRPLNSLTLTTVASYTDVDAAYIKATSGNNNSSFDFTIKVGGETVYTDGPIPNSGNVFKLYGGNFATPKTGQISFVFSGQTALKLNSIAFNYINA